MSNPINNQHHVLTNIIERFTGQDGVHSTCIPSLSLIRESTISEPVSRVNEPSFCIIVQGEKMVWLGEECFRYGPGNYIVASVDLPVTGQVVKASSDSPYLALKLEFTSSEILEVLRGRDHPSGQKRNAKRAMFISEVEPCLLDAVIRLACLLDKQEHIPVLAPLFKKEILYWILQSPHGEALNQMALEGSNAIKIRSVIEYIIHNYEKAITIDDLAKIANLSVASLHRHFKDVTAMSPIQFQKQLRLQEAKRLLFAKSSDVSDVAYRVGYESLSQFSREYSRMFGYSPRADINRMRKRSV